MVRSLPWVVPRVIVLVLMAFLVIAPMMGISLWTNIENAGIAFAAYAAALDTTTFAIVVVVLALAVIISAMFAAGMANGLRERGFIWGLSPSLLRRSVVGWGRMVKNPLEVVTRIVVLATTIVNLRRTVWNDVYPSAAGAIHAFPSSPNIPLTSGTMGLGVWSGAFSNLSLRSLSGLLRAIHPNGMFGVLARR